MGIPPFPTTVSLNSVHTAGTRLDWTGPVQPGLVRSGMTLSYWKHSQCPTIILFRWVFHWIKATAAPALLTKHSLERNFIFLTDQDSKAFDAFDAAQSKVYPNSKHRLCAWHKVTNLVSLKGLRVGQDNLAATQMTTVQKWVFSLIFNSESELEYKDSLQKLFHWLGSDTTRHRGALGMRNCQLIEAWLNNNFNQPSLLPRLLQYHFKGRRMLDKRTTGGSESWFGFSSKLAHSVLVDLGCWWSKLALVQCQRS